MTHTPFKAEADMLLELADRCEATTAKQQHLMFLEVYNRTVATGIIKWGHKEAGRFSDFLRVGAYLDAAMSLVPEGCDWMLGRFDMVVGGEGPCASVFWQAGELADEAEAKAATPALALCAASLRARAESAK